MLVATIRNERISVCEIDAIAERKYVPVFGKFRELVILAIIEEFSSRTDGVTTVCDIEKLVIVSFFTDTCINSVSNGTNKFPSMSAMTIRC